MLKLGNMQVWPEQQLSRTRGTSQIAHEPKRGPGLYTKSHAMLINVCTLVCQRIRLRDSSSTCLIPTNVWRLMWLSMYLGRTISVLMCWNNPSLGRKLTNLRCDIFYRMMLEAVKVTTVLMVHLFAIGSTSGLRKTRCNDLACSMWFNRNRLVYILSLKWDAHLTISVCLGSVLHTSWSICTSHETTYLEALQEYHAEMNAVPCGAYGDIANKHICICYYGPLVRHSMQIIRKW